MSKSRKFLDGTLKTDWSDPIPYTGEDSFLDSIRLPDGNDFKYGKDLGADPIPAELRMIASLVKGNSNLWEDPLVGLTYKWEKTFDNGSAIFPPEEITTNDPNESAYLKLAADGYRDDQVLVIKHNNILGKAYFRVTQTFSPDPNDATKDIVFVEDIDVIDIQDGIDRKALDASADTQIILYDSGNGSFEPKTSLITAFYSNLPNSNSFTWYYNNGTGYTKITGTEPFYSISGTRNTLLGVTFQLAPVSVTGTVTTTGTAVVGTGTTFLADFTVGSYIKVLSTGETQEVTVIGGDTSITVKSPFVSDVTNNAIEKIDSFFSKDKETQSKQFAVSTHTSDPTLADGDVHLTDYITLSKSEVSAIGESATYATLTQESYTAVIDSTTGNAFSGELGSGGNAQTDIEVRIGGTKLNYASSDFTILQESITSGFSATIRQSTKDSTNGNVYLNEPWTTGTERSCKIVLVITVASSGVILKKEFTVSSTIDAPGAIILDIDSLQGFTFDRGSSGLNPKVLDANLYKIEAGVQSKIDTSAYYFNWSGAVSRNWAIGASSSPVINRADIYSSGDVRARVSVNASGNPVLADSTVKITDISDAKTYRLYSTSTSTPTKPINTTTPEADQSGWKASQVGALWASDGAEISSTTNDPTYSFSQPYRIAGEQGSQGESGGFLLTVFKLSPKGTTPALPTTETNLNGWSYSAPTSQGGQYLWTTQRSWKAFDSNGDPVQFDNGKPNTPAMAGSYWLPATQISGFDGINGNFIEFRYKSSSSSSSAPSLQNNVRNPIGWTTDYPARVIGNFIWSTKVLINGETDAIIGLWSPPTLHTGEVGATGATGAKGVDGVDGADGIVPGIKQIFGGIMGFNGTVSSTWGTITCYGSSTSTGVYTINHDLGTTNYAVQLTAAGAVGTRTLSRDSRLSSRFTVTTRDNNNALNGVAFEFLIITY